jgi:hypothetical protein
VRLKGGFIMTNNYFITGIKDLLAERVLEISNNCIKDEKYKAISSELMRFQDEIIELLPEENQKLFLNLEDAESQRSNYVAEKVYRQGICDGIILANLFRKIADMEKDFDFRL